VKTPYRWLLALILVTYAVLGVLYAVFTPPWQVPDEPAHYNYIRAIAEEGALPVMAQGDYDQAYLERITDQENPFPPDLSIDPITYEDHQPPLYYLVATLVYLLFDGALLPLRLLSVAMGFGTLLIAHGLIRQLFPQRPEVPLVATALIAFVPQHLAMMAGVENDALAELLVAAGLWMAVRYVHDDVNGRQFLVGWGLTLGLVVLTKVSAYVVLPVALLAVGLRARREGRSLGWLAGRAAWIFWATAALAGPWLIRNVSLYGWYDPLGMARHNLVVEGQPRTAAWVAEYGPGGLLWRMARTTFQSFWGQFGWMGVPLQPAIYLALLMLTGLLFVGFVAWTFGRRRARLTPPQVDGLILLGASGLLTALIYLAYNLTFVQHQGRYLFPALIPLALGAALSLEWLLSPRGGRWATAGLAGSGTLLLLAGLFRGDLILMPTAAAFGLAVLTTVAAQWPRWGRWLALVALSGGLVALDVYSLFGAIVPTLTG
jgi:4-amino-4-deoxy-L-arabinose transferase-like glycosyltransferase